MAISSRHGESPRRVFTPENAPLSSKQAPKCAPSPVMWIGDTGPIRGKDPTSRPRAVMHRVHIAVLRLSTGQQRRSDQGQRRSHRSSANLRDGTLASVSNKNSRSSRADRILGRGTAAKGRDGSPAWSTPGRFNLRKMKGKLPSRARLAHRERGGFQLGSAGEGDALLGGCRVQALVQD